MNIHRASKLATSAGTCLAASTSGAGSVESFEFEGTKHSLGSVRLACVDGLFVLLGDAYRKDPEIALVVGEALAKYADSLGDGIWASDAKVWPMDLDEEFAKDLPPHEQVSKTYHTKFHSTRSV